MKRIYKSLIVVAGVLFLTTNPLAAQERKQIHSHNDYRQLVPFYQAYSQRVTSIEADLFYKDGALLIGHDLEDLSKDATFDEMYVQPLVKIFKQNGGKAWKNSDDKLTLLVELKSATEPTLTAVVKLLGKYPEVFNPAKNANAVKIAITGNVPKRADFKKYPKFISFDGTFQDYSSEELGRVAMISVPFFEYAHWNGKGAMTAPQKAAVQGAIDAAHKLNKPIRFWASPDGVTAWNTLHHMGVDIINTDKVELCADYFSNFVDKNYYIDGSKHAEMTGVKGTDRLDKITSGFKGFDREKIQLSQAIDLYNPTYLNDGLDKPVKNVILLIGDGMGINQMTVAAAANKGLTVFKMKNVGFQKNEPLDSFTSDSAAGGSALATGKPHNNRHIAMDGDGTPVLSITDYAYDKGLANGVVTLGNIADATPTAFYGHCTERDSSDVLTQYLLDGKITVVAGGGTDVFTKREDGLTIKDFEKKYDFVYSVDEIDASKKRPVLCVDNLMDLAATQETLDLLANTTRRSIDKLVKASDKGFFLMVEGAKIDYAGHSNSLAGCISEMLSFDLAIAEAMKFADSNGETLIVVTADHETGGLTMVDGDSSKGLVTARYTTDDHSPAMPPVFAYGPGAQYFRGVQWNYDIANTIKKLLGL